VSIAIKAKYYDLGDLDRGFLVGNQSLLGTWIPVSHYDFGGIDGSTEL
jgi:hypothetical protein